MSAVALSLTALSLLSYAPALRPLALHSPARCAHTVMQVTHGASSTLTAATTHTQKKAHGLYPFSLACMHACR